MRKLIVAVGMLGLFSCSQQEGLKISGKYESPIDGQWAKIELIKNEALTVVDSFQIDASGEFERIVKIEEPAFYRLNFYNRHMANMILNDSDVEVYKEGEDQQAAYKIRGSRDMDFIYGLVDIQKGFKEQINELNQKAQEAMTKMSKEEFAEERKKFESEYMEKLDIHENQMMEEIFKMDNSVAGMLSVSFLESMEDEKKFKFLSELAEKYQKQLPNSTYTKELSEKVETLRKLAVGSMAPDLALPTPGGETLALSSLRGKYVLLDFWAAWCGPCRQENPNVVKMYQKYGGEKFEILGVSLDRKKESWLQAIEDDGLMWPQISDLKYFESEAARLYNINAIPATYLIGPDGKIVAKNLRGSSLEKKLEEIFG